VTAFDRELSSMNKAHVGLGRMPGNFQRRRRSPGSDCVPAIRKPLAPRRVGIHSDGVQWAHRNCPSCRGAASNWRPYFVAELNRRCPLQV